MNKDGIYKIYKIKLKTRAMLPDGSNRRSRRTVTLRLISNNAWINGCCGGKMSKYTSFSIVMVSSIESLANSMDCD